MLTILRINWDLFLTGPCAKNDKRLRPEWQAHRLNLFTTYTLPSLIRQTMPNWRAWICCDPDLWPLHGPLADACAGDVRCRIVYDTTVAARDVCEYFPHAQPVLYGRIDSDDMFHPKALARWEAEAARLDRGQEFLQFGDGYGIEVTTNGEPARPLTGRIYEWNHFSAAVLARVCRVADFAGGPPDLGGNHGKVHEFARRIDDGRYYAIALHGDNLCNQVRSRWVGPEVTGVRLAVVKKEFCL